LVAVSYLRFLFYFYNNTAILIDVKNMWAKKPQF